MFIPASLNHFPITVPAHRKRLEDILNGTCTFPGHGVNGICLYGSFGTGKTTLARLLPAWLESGGHLPPNSATGNLWPMATPTGLAPFAQTKKGATTIVRCGQQSVLSMLHSLEKTLDDASASFTKSGYHYVIFDEAQGLKQQAMKPMRSMMSATDQAVFIFTTNDYPSLDGGIKSRCYEVEMNLPSPQQLIGVGQNMLRGMGLTLDPTRLAEIASGVRDYRKFSAALQEVGVPA